MTTLQIKALPPEEKLRIMEAIWVNMRDQYENAPIPSELLELLRHYQKRVAKGEARSTPPLPEEDGMVRKKASVIHNDIFISVISAGIFS